MRKYTLTVLDTSGIQNYLFGTNNLKQNAGASYLADCATSDWVKEILDRVVPNAHNVIDFNAIEKSFDPARTMDDDAVQAEVIYAGGGNTTILFKEYTQAKEFAMQLSRKVIVDAPDLNLVIAHQAFDWDNEALGSESGVVQCVMNQLRLRKQQQPPAQPLRGLGVTVDGVFTYRPAVGYDTQQRPVSAESWAKQCAERAAEKRLLKFLCESIDSDTYSIPRDFEDIGSSHEESSYIAIVHADGNGMGNRVKAIQSNYPNAAQNGDYVKAMRTFSLSVQRAAHAALNATVTYLVDKIIPSKEADRHGNLVSMIGGKIELKNDRGNGGRPFLPFRPIVFGGDDVTFVCEGRLGLQLATHYLQEFTKQTLSDGGQAYCRAGVAVTHSHYPFALAYALAEDLCKSAKAAIKHWREEPLHHEESITAIDWHFAVNGMNEGLAKTRKHGYASDAGNLLMRPIRISEPDLNWHSWQQFADLMEAFQSPQWQERRNKLIGLREPLRRGPKAVEQYRLAYGLDTLPSIGAQRTMVTTGWQGNECGYFDAIEALDFYVALKDKADETSESEAA